jgi:hypothetical protein
MEKIRQDTSPNALRGIEICESRVSKHNDIESINKYKAELNYLRKLRLYDIKNQLLISELLQTCDRFQLSK